MQPTPQYTWPLLNQRLGTEAWVKHENHTAGGAFKMRGALVYLEWLHTTRPDVRGVIAATRGNHGQGVAMAARLMGLEAVIVVPHGNSKEKNRAMAAQGAELVEHGHDFQESLEFARELAKERGLAVERGLAMVDSFHERLVMGTASYALEFFEGTPEMARVYVPIGLGSSICGVCAARNALGLKTEVVGVVAAGVAIVCAELCGTQGSISAGEDAHCRRAGVPDTQRRGHGSDLGGGSADCRGHG